MALLRIVNDYIARTIFPAYIYYSLTRRIPFALV